MKITNLVHDMMENTFEAILLGGGFPEVNFKKSASPCWESVSYNMFEYTNVWAQFAHLVHSRLIGKMGVEDGIYTRKRSKAFVADFQGLLSEVTEEAIMKHQERFATWMD